MTSYKFKSYTPRVDPPSNLPEQPMPAYDDLSAISDSSVKGSFAYDQQNGYTFCWKDLDEANAWHAQEEKDKIIELIHKETIRSPAGMEGLWLEKRVYVCARGPTGGRTEYIKKRNYDRKIPNKRVGCQCRLTIKLYPHTGMVLGQYTDVHTHEIGNNNARFTRLSKDSRDEIERLLRLGVEPRKVLEQVQGKIYSEDNLPNIAEGQALRNEFCTRSDVRRIEKMIEAESVRLAGQDGASILEWVGKLKREGHLVALKTANTAPLHDSGLADDVFVLIIQTKYQKQCWESHGRRFAAIDATHNTTHYENMSLFTLLVRDRWGHGVPAAWMISSNATADTISYFLKLIRNENPGVTPKFFMSDKDRAQLNAMEWIYPESTRFLCWWHVLHAWQQHFVTAHFPELWDLLKSWIRITNATDFSTHWEKIKTIAPTSIVEYLTTNWMNETELWSAVFRGDRNVFQDCDTNMLVEAWHHVLKGTFLEGKRNRRLDHLIHILVQKAMPYFMHKHRRQELGFEGPDLEVKKRIEIEARSKSIAPHEISTTSESDIYLVKSSTSDIKYCVDLDLYECTCLAFPLIRFCKHICAVEREYGMPGVPILPVSMLNIHHTNSIERLHFPIPEIPSSSTAEHGEKDTVLRDVNLINNLSQLAIVLQNLDLWKQMSDLHLTALSFLRKSVHDMLNMVTSLTDARDHMLPKKEHVAPNQHSWPQTVAVMGVPVKSKRKAHTDPYAGGEQSGKKAKKDARKRASEEDIEPQESSSSTPTAPQVAISTSKYTFQLASSAPSTQIQDEFDPAKVDLRDVAYLKSLKRDQLYKVCYHYGIPAAGKNSDIVSRLNTLHRTK